ncbi:MAG: hypothetical protein R3C28_11370 [Pirellulaceae bacterium]
MPADITAAEQFNSDFGDLRKHELLPSFFNPDPSSSDLLRARFLWFLFNVRDTSTVQHAAYGRSTPTVLPRTVIAPALGVNAGIAREVVVASHVASDEDLNIYRLEGKNNKRIHLLTPTIEEVQTLMKWRSLRELEAAIAVHQVDEWSDGTPKNPGMKRDLAETLNPIVQLMSDTITDLNTTTHSELDKRIKAELIWQADMFIRDRLFAAAGMICERGIAQRVREKIRLVDGYEKTILMRAAENVAQLKTVLDAVLSSCDSRRGTAERIVDAITIHMQQETAHLVTLSEMNGN